LRAHFHFAGTGEAEERTGPGADHLANLDTAGEDQAAGWRANVKATDLGAGSAKLGLCDANAGVSGIARSPLAIEIGLADESTAHQGLTTLKFILSQCSVGARGLDLRGELRCRLRLHLAVHGRQDLALTNPAARIDQHRADKAAFAGNADRLVAAGGKSARSSHDSRDLRTAWDDDGYGRDLAAAAGRTGAFGGLFVLAAAHVNERGNGQRGHDYGSDDDVTPTPGPVDND
jgi:hypothetical protein